MLSALGSARLPGEGGSSGGVAVGLIWRGGPLPAPSVAQPSHQLGSL